MTNIDRLREIAEYEARESEDDDDRTAHPDHHDGPQWGDIAWH